MTPSLVIEAGSLAETPTELSMDAVSVLSLGASETIRVPDHVARHVVSGTTALGIGIFIERGAGFAANILAARYAGASTFGAYSLAISTANNISTYAAGGIGATAARFSGKYPFNGSGYYTLARSLILVSLVSAGLAALALWAGAAPIAHLLHKSSLTGLLRWAAISAAGIILLECARGFFVGQRRLAALVLLSLLVGVGMVSLLPLAGAMHKPVRMIVSQGAVTLTAVAACVLLAKPLGLLTSESSASHLPLLPMLQEVWGFGFVQLAGLVGANLSGWWLTALVARSDSTLVQMSYFAIASQLRNLAGLIPGLLTEGSYAVMANPAEEHLRTPHHVMALCTFGSTTVALTLAGLGMVAAPWGLLHLYGSSYHGAALTASIGLATAVVHMGNAPAAARLTIVSIRAAGVINTLWAVAVAVCATVLLLHGGSAALAMGIFFGAHVLAAGLVLIVLARKDFLPDGMVTLFLLATGSVIGLAVIALFWSQASYRTPLFPLAMSLTLAGAMFLLIALGKRQGWFPTVEARKGAYRALRSKVQRLLHARKQRVIHGL